MGGTEEEYIDFVEFRGIGNMGAPWKGRWRSGRDGERKKSDSKVGSKIYKEAGSRICKRTVYEIGQCVWIDILYSNRIPRIPCEDWNSESSCRKKASKEARNNARAPFWV